MSVRSFGKTGARLEMAVGPRRLDPRERLVRIEQLERYLFVCVGRRGKGRRREGDRGRERNGDGEKEGGKGAERQVRNPTNTVSNLAKKNLVIKNAPQYGILSPTHLLMMALCVHSWHSLLRNPLSSSIYGCTCTTPNEWIS